jgi:tRNA(Arg) A34 adenosine deaminase TadA
MADPDADAAYLREAIALAAPAGDGVPRGPFGALVVRGGTVLGRGRNGVVPAHDPTAHAEIVAIREACRAAGSHDLAGAVLYASCEPCPMCYAAARWAGIGRIVYGAGRSDAADAGFRDAALYEDLRRAPGARAVGMRQLLADEARAVLADWARAPDRIPY